MPTGNLPAKAKALWESVYNKYKGKGMSEKEAAKRAWGAIEQAGWHKKDDKWVKSKKSTALAEFSFVIKKATLDPETGERRWRADTSDTEIDSYGDKMSLQLYSDFLRRIEEAEPAPDEYRSDFWSGGNPYLSVSHYPDMNGSAVPGEVDVIFIDGNYLKAKGKFYETPLGIACWEAIKADLDSETDDKVRISIAFLDYKHRHLSTDYTFERADLDDICPECLLGMITGESDGKEFLEGHLIHLALTRVPVNRRTIMEVDKSMATKKEDASTIIGEELAEELEEKAKAIEVGRALVTKSEDGSIVIEIPGLEQLATMLSEIRELVTPVEEAEVEEEVEEAEEVEETPQEEEPLGQLTAVLGQMADGFNAMSQKMDMLISQNARDPQVAVPQRRAVLSEQEIIPTKRRDPNKPLSIKEATYLSVYGRLPEETS